MTEKKFILVKAQPFVSIITLNWNQTEITCQFLESTRELNYKHYETLVCDMGSAADPTAQIYAGNYPNMRILKADGHRENIVTRAIQQAKGDFVLLVNNHTELSKNTLDELLAPFLTDHNLGVTCPKIRSFYKKNEIQYAGYNSLNIFTGRNHIVGYQAEDKGQFDIPLYTNGAYSGAMMIKKNIIAQSGILPPHFFVYFDDSDFSARILKSGYKILYQPRAVVYNKARIRPYRKSAIQVFYNTRNRIRFMCQNSSVMQCAVFLFFFSVLTVPATTIQFVLMRKFSHLQSFYKGIWWNIKRGTKVYA
ncbi:MAG TPA: glycosyltransferase family 2 protein [Agriterribacter sp.]|nr:glycosyltransferase family 2 protein [Chitinophagaceae bacterium]HRP30777.1 glycosyltransferase family 2 protein [Agriterribacter sp.]